MDDASNNSEERRISDFFPGMHLGLKKSIKEGFDVLARLSKVDRSKVLTDAVSSINTPVVNSSADKGNLAIVLGISEKDAASAKNSALSVAMSICNRDGDIDQKFFIDSAIREGVLLKEQSEIAREIFQLVTDQYDLVKSEIDGPQNMDDVLPLLRLFDITVDMKLKFDQSGISKMYPVAVLHIDTDSYAQEVWLQISKRQIEKIIAELNTVFEQMKMAEKAATNMRLVNE
jgi:hypothetical protein